MEMPSEQPPAPRLSPFAPIASALIALGWVVLLGVRAYYLLHQQPYAPGIRYGLLLLALLNILALVGLLIALIGGRGRHWRVLGLLWLLLAGTLGGYFAIMQATARQEDAVWQMALRQVAASGKPVISAIMHYKFEQNDTLPPSLDALKSDYLRSVPSTGLWAFPRFTYIVASDKSWRLSVRCSRGFAKSSVYEFRFPPVPAMAQQFGPGVDNWFYLTD